MGEWDKVVKSVFRTTNELDNQQEDYYLTG